MMKVAAFTIQKGFTIIELIIIISVIGILTGIGYQLSSNNTNKSAAAVLYGNLEVIDAALKSYGHSDGISEWWPQSEFGSTSKDDNPLISHMQQTTDLRRFIASIPEPPVELSTSYAYSNHEEFVGGSSYNPDSCNGAADGGVSLVISVANQNNRGLSVLALVDEQFDDGDSDCGQITIIESTNETHLYYHIAVNSTDYPPSF